MGRIDIGNLDAGYVEGLGGGDAGDGVFHVFLGQGGPGGVIVAGVGEFAVDLIGDHEDAVPAANLGHQEQFFPGPHASHGVVGVAQEENLAAGRQLFEEVPVHYEVLAVVLQGAVLLDALVVADGGEESVVAGSHHQHLVSGYGHRLDGGAVGRNHTGGGNDILPADSLPAVPGAEPSAHYLKITVRQQFVAEDAVVQPFLEGLLDFGGDAEVHIGYPHGQGAGIQVPFYAFRPLAGGTLVEIVHIIEGF